MTTHRAHRTTRSAPPRRRAGPALTALVVALLGMLSSWVPGASAANIAVNRTSACAVQSDSTVRCWGQNAMGELGNGSAEASETPVTVVAATTSGTAPLTGAVGIAAGNEHVCALLSTGGVACWGSNASGQLGHAPTTFEPNPRPVTVSGISDAVALAAGGAATCAVHVTGRISCWGLGVTGAKPGAAFTVSAKPITLGWIDDAVGITLSSEQFCAARASGATECWTFIRTLSPGSAMASATPIDLPGIADARSLGTSAFGHRCIARNDGRAGCWGNNTIGQLGIGVADSVDRYASPPVILDVPGITDAIAVATPWASTCALHETGRISCWGDGATGALGTGTTANSPSPVDVVGISTATELSGSAGSYVCAVLADRTVWCWGSRSNGTTSTTQLQPEQVDGVVVRSDTNYPEAAPIGRAAAARPRVEVLRRGVLPGGGATTDAGTKLAAAVGTVARRAAKAKPRLAVRSGYLAASAAPLAPSAGRRCPQRVVITVSTHHSRHQLSWRTAATTKVRCAVSGVAELPTRFAKAARLTIALSGPGLKTTTRVATP